MVRVSIDLKNGLFDEFAMKCTKIRKKKAEVIRQLIERWVKGAES